jgi:hypothetical protein
MPHIGIDYITDESKAAITTVQNLDLGRDFSEQFTATAKLNGHYAKPQERKYYHFKLSPAPGDNASVEAVHALAERVASESFKGHECVISTHTDTPIVHGHIIINAVNFETGKKMNVRNHAYGQMKEKANVLGAEHGMSAIDFHKKGKRVLVAEAMHDLQEAIDLAKHETTNMTDFKAYLRKYGVVVRETQNTISYLHPQRKRPIRGDKIGEQYTKGAILDEFNKQRDRGAAEAVREKREERRDRGGAAESARGTGAIGGRGEGKVRKPVAEKEPVGEYTDNDAGILEIENAVRSVDQRVWEITPEGREEQERMARAAEQKSVQTPEPERTTPKQHKPKDRGFER